MIRLMNTKKTVILCDLKQIANIVLYVMGLNLTSQFLIKIRKEKNIKYDVFSLGDNHYVVRG